MSHFHRITPLPVRHVKTSMQCVLYPVPVSSRLPRKILNEIFFLNLGEISENDVSKFNRYWMLFWFMGGVVAKTKTPTSNDLKPGLSGVSRRRKFKPWISALALESLFSQVRPCVHLRSLWVVLRWPALCLEMKSCIQCKETCPFGHPTRRPEEEDPFIFFFLPEPDPVPVLIFLIK